METNNWTYALDVNLSKTSIVERTVRQTYGNRLSKWSLVQRTAHLRLDDIPYLLLVSHYFLIVLRFHLVELIHLPLQHRQCFPETLKIYQTRN